jgi:hypothetical protein
MISGSKTMGSFKAKNRKGENLKEVKYAKSNQNGISIGSAADVFGISIGPDSKCL